MAEPHIHAPLSVHPNVDLARRGYDAFARGDLAAMMDFLAPDVVWHVGGDGPLSGAHQGLHAVEALFARVFELTGGSQRIDIEDIFASDEQLVTVLRERATRSHDGLVLDVREAHVMRLRPDQKIVEVWDVPDDPAAHDAFFS